MGAWAQNGEESNGYPDFVKFAYSIDFYLGEISPGVMGAHKAADISTFKLDVVGEGRYIFALDYAKTGDYGKGRYLFNDYPGDGTEAIGNNYLDKAIGDLALVEAIHKGDALYVLGDVPVADVSQLDALAQAGTIRKIDLKEKNNFVFSFVPFEEFAAECVIESEAGGQIAIDSQNGKAKVRTDGIRSAFIVESAGQNDPPGSDPGSDPNANESIAEPVQVRCNNGILTVQTPAAEQIDVYSINGALLYQVQKASGEATLNLSRLPQGVLIVRGGSGWTRKIVR
jgi:hypothetical protein